MRALSLICMIAAAFSVNATGLPPPPTSSTPPPPPPSGGSPAPAAGGLKPHRCHKVVAEDLAWAKAALLRLDAIKCCKDKKCGRTSDLAKVYKEIADHDKFRYGEIIYLVAPIFAHKHQEGAPVPKPAAGATPAVGAPKAEDKARRYTPAYRFLMKKIMSVVLKAITEAKERVPPRPFSDAGLNLHQRLIQQLQFKNYSPAPTDKEKKWLSKVIVRFLLNFSWTNGLINMPGFEAYKTALNTAKTDLKKKDAAPTAAILHTTLKGAFDALMPKINAERKKHKLPDYKKPEKPKKV